MYWSYRGHDARFHWFTHLFVGASVALVAMAAVTLRTGRPVPYPLAWPVLGHLFAMAPDLAFSAGVAHRQWMDVFVGHISTHYVPGRNPHLVRRVPRIAGPLPRGRRPYAQP